MRSSESGRLTREDVGRVVREVEREIRRRPPVIGLIGVSGVGKSSTINSLFKTTLAVSDTVACTKEFSVNEVAATIWRGDQSKKAILKVIDAPGLGEDVRQDPTYLSMYKQHLPECDVVLWVLAARNRAVALDQKYLAELSLFHDRIVFGMNQVDLVEPLDWDGAVNLPSRQQEDNINIITKDRAERLSAIMGREVKVIPYSSRRKYNLSVVFSELLSSCPADRAWVFDAIKGFRYDDFVPEDLRSLVSQRLSEQRRNEEDIQPKGVGQHESVEQSMSKGQVVSATSNIKAQTSLLGAIVLSLEDILRSFVRLLKNLGGGEL